MIRNTCAAALAITLMLSVAAFSGVPGEMNFQGRLTDSLGAAVADGVYSVDFTIYDNAIGGASFWSETQNVSTSDGYFTVILGTINPLLDTVFNETTRYLGVAVDADPEMTPRIALVTVPYAHRVSTIDGSSGGAVSGDVEISSSSIGNALSVNQADLGRAGYFQISNGANSEAAVQGTTVGSGPGGSFFSDGGGPGLSATATGGTAAEMYGALKTYGDEYVFDGVDTAVHVDASASQIRTFGDDGLEQIRLWGTSYGEILLHDGTDNDITARLSASSNSGGALTLADEVGATQIYMDGGNSGDASTQLPLDAINKSEILDEPGLASAKWLASLNLPLGGPDTIVIRTITVPTNGYVVAMFTTQLTINHIQNVATSAVVSIVPPGEVFANGANTLTTVPVNAPTGFYYLSAAVTALFSVSAGANQFTVQGQGYADFATGSAAASESQLTLLFVPTLYGTASPNNAAVIAGDDPPSAAEELAQAKVFTEQRIQDELASIQAKLELLQNQLDRADN